MIFPVIDVLTVMQTCISTISPQGSVPRHWSERGWRQAAGLWGYAALKSDLVMCSPITSCLSWVPWIAATPLQRLILHQWPPSLLLNTAWEPLCILRQNGSHSIILRSSTCTSVLDISIWILRSSLADCKLSSWSLSKIRVPCCEACAVSRQSTWIYPCCVFSAGIPSGFNGPQLCESAFG